VAAGPFWLDPLPGFERGGDPGALPRHHDDPGIRLPRRIGRLNMLGSIFFMASALASYVLPRSDDVLSTRVAVAGTLLGALCFLIGAMLMFPAWRASATEEADPTPDLR
jgi:hypothetical protein